MAGFTLSSKEFSGQVPMAHVYDDFGAGGGNQSPQLSWENAPEGTKSFLITCFDADAPGPGWWHWCAFNIPTSANGLNTGDSKTAMPGGTVQTKNSYGSFGYGGACPPPGDAPHAYHIVLHALDIDKLDLDENTSPAMVMFMAR